MGLYKKYLVENKERKNQGLDPKPIDCGDLLTEIITQIKDLSHCYRNDSLHFLIYNVLPGTTEAAAVKASFLNEIIQGKTKIKEISPVFAFELLSFCKSTFGYCAWCRY